MNHIKTDVGKDIFSMIKENKAPWGVGTTAIIAGFAVRLIHMSLVHSEERGMENRIYSFFELSDKDSVIFSRYLGHKKERLNLIPNKLVDLVIEIYEELLNRKYKIKDSMKVDYKMGIEYLYLTANESLNIINANHYQEASMVKSDIQKDKLYLLKEKLDKKPF